MEDLACFNTIILIDTTLLLRTSQTTTLRERDREEMAREREEINVRFKNIFGGSFDPTSIDDLVG